MLETSIFSFTPQCLLPYQKTYIIILAILNLSSAGAFNLAKSKILSLDKGFNYTSMMHFTKRSIKCILHNKKNPDPNVWKNDISKFRKFRNTKRVHQRSSCKDRGHDTSKRPSTLQPYAYTWHWFTIYKTN